MSYNISFKETDGLKTTNIVSPFSNKKYYMVNYDKSKLHLENISNARSLVFNEEKELVCFSPPKSIPTDEFIKKYPYVCSYPIVAEEFVEGTMVNIFWNGDDWEICTRKTIGNKFREMFLECLGMDFTTLNKNICYSFVMQHPKNRIVLQFISPVLYLIDAYKIDLENNIVHSVLNETCTFFNENPEYRVQFPRRYNNNSYSRLIQLFASMNTPYYIMGIVFRNLLTGERTKARNPVYEEVKNMRGNKEKLQYQYFCLRQAGRVGEYLKNFHENKNDFFEFREQLHLYTDVLHKNYISCYIKKELRLGDFPPQFRKRMFNLNKIYLEQKKYISKNVVVDYMNGLHPSVLIYTLNYNKKKLDNDVEKCLAIKK